MSEFFLELFSEEIPPRLQKNAREEILKRIEFQWPEEEKVGMADFVIHNDGSEKELNDNIKSLIKKLI